MSLYKDKIEHLFKTKQSKDAWRGLKKLSGYRSKSCMPEPEDIPAFANELKFF